MDLIQALKKADGKPVMRESWPNLSHENGIIIRNGWLDWKVSKADQGFHQDNILADDWYVVEPKSPIEEAIEREVSTYWAGISNSGKVVRELESSMSRIVNLTLDEAKKAAWGNGTIESAGRHCGSERIDALKVKE